MPKYRKFTQEYRDEAVLMVIQSQRPIAQVARELGINEGTLGTWVSKYRSEHPVTEELSLPDRAKLKELERENRELRLMNDFLKKRRPTSPGSSSERQVRAHCRGAGRRPRTAAAGGVDVHGATRVPLGLLRLAPRAAFRPGGATGQAR